MMLSHVVLLYSYFGSFFGMFRRLGYVIIILKQIVELKNESLFIYKCVMISQMYDFNLYIYIKKYIFSSSSV